MSFCFASQPLYRGLSADNWDVLHVASMLSIRKVSVENVAYVHLLVLMRNKKVAVHDTYLAFGRVGSRLVSFYLALGPFNSGLSANN